MKIIIAKDYTDMSKAAANVIAEQLKQKADSKLGLATGSTPIGMYKELVELYKKGAISFKGVTSFNLDEYIGLEQSHDQSYYYFMMQNLFSHIDIDLSKVNLPHGAAADIDAEIKRYNDLLNANAPLDIQVLGIGNNGHIGFNEPADAFQKEVGSVDLAQSTIDANARFFASADEVPKRAISMGIKSIMGAKRILLLASGEGKKEIIHRSLTGDITPAVPASVLQLHPDVTVVLDEQAGALVKDLV